MDIRKIKKLIELLIEHDLQSIEVKDGEQSVNMTRRSPDPVIPAYSEVPQSAVKHSITTPAGAVECAPMVGVFYTAPSPNEPNFVKAGQAVKPGDTLGIIEAMKIMNPLEATQGGVVAEVLVKNGEVVEFGQPIIRYQA